jgi:predicted RNase H-like nuclease
VFSLLEYVLEETLRTDVKPDDVLDAAVAFVTSEASNGELTSLSGDPLQDEVG